MEAELQLLVQQRELADVAAAEAAANLQAEMDRTGAFASANGLLGQQLGANQVGAQQAIGQGVQNTRQNYGSRGLLYSSLRQGGEQQVRTQGALGLAQENASDTSQAQSAVDQYETMYNNIDLSTQEQNNQLATQANSIAMQNQIAAAQSQQQLASGIGQGLGAIAGGLMSPSINTATPDLTPAQYNGLLNPSGQAYDPTGGGYGGMMPANNLDYASAS